MPALAPVNQGVIALIPGYVNKGGRTNFINWLMT
jgi:hypothetical protein